MKLRYTLLSLLVSLLVGCGSETLDRAQLATFRQALALYREQKFPQTEALLQKIRSAKPNHVEVEVLLARTFFYTKRSDEAEAILRGVLKKRPHNPYASLWLGRVLMVRPDGVSLAADIFRGVLREDPDNGQAHYYLGQCLELQGKPKEALTAYSRSLAAEQQISRAHLQTARLLTRLDLPERAARHATAVTRLAASSHDVREAEKLLQPNGNGAKQ